MDGLAGVVLALLLGMCVCTDIVYRVTEEQSGGMFIGNVALDSNLNLNLSESDYRTLRYSVLASTTDNDHQYFTINQTTGNLYTSSLLDREVICPYTDQCKLDIEITAQSAITSYFKKLTIIVYIDDVNDHYPVFLKTSQSLTIPESVLPGTSFTVDGAKDADRSTNYGIQSYILYPQDLPFSVNFVKNLDGTSVVRIIVDGTLDRESRDLYELTLVAKDGGVPPKTADLSVDVHVTDVNDNAPVLSRKTYNETVREDMPVGSTLLTLSATDLDSGRNGEVRYGISPHQTETIKNLFFINATSGELILINPLTYVRGNSYKIIVEVSDRGQQPMTTQTYVIVTVLDSGNNPPEIILGLLTNGVAKISEYAPFGTTVAHVAVVDQDSGHNGIVMCSLDSTIFELQVLDINEYRVLVSQALDRERLARHSVTVSCQDSGTPMLVSNANFFVEVLDVNDNAPIFHMQTYSASIDENNKIGKEILQVTATDYDEGQNAEVKYRLLHSNDTVIQVDAHTGIIRANAVFDRERMSSFMFKVLAIDGGSPPKSGTTTVSVTVQDVNDEKPQFLENLFIFKRKENRQAGTIVGRLMAMDDDEGDSGRVVFSLAEESPIFSTLPFVVYSDGIIKTTSELDRERKKFYDFKVMASDLGRPTLSSTANVKIFIEDENDNSPNIIFPSYTNNTIVISVGTPPGSVIGTVRAQDPDEGLNGEVSYSFDGDNQTSYFRIFSETGDVILQKSVELFAGSVFSLNIIATDQGDPPRSSRQTMKIIIGTTLGSNKNINIIIVVSLVGVTLVLSTGIILVICIIRRIDTNKERSRKPTSDTITSNGLAGVPNNTYGTLNKPVAEVISELERKRKEVTFAFSPDQQIPSDETYYEDKGHKSVGKQVSYGEHVSQAFLKLQDDNHSETSGETNTSDSGRGLSDDEVHGSRGGSYSKGRVVPKSKPNMEVNVYQNQNTFFPDGREPISPISLPRFTAYPPYTSNNGRYQGDTGSSYAVHRPLQTFHFGTKSSSIDDDSGSTSGIHTMDEDFTAHLKDSVI
ncbi:protocadherin beta-2-like isoform X1 [Pecten maximus]|uniref:protocadherin beta-2-like isoform X1 n=1 Tax=Pecten maximus TaxID=6579 RepID=UPI001458C4B5|nr:protocadherin beta-2-like isoform X1 [Pecten maximus]XP_033743978.1 protocadherin beta-2-like isoform X1 [Pecten maximus]XP_033743979.1 protocadherin beta-2-like isoform X1 [Pecten maximus]XP_033743980.1 protocadherin beta-2-like isoform X1 [Pecten maximus]XP_033743981.1 protocadherin beta-2-like isoform X1 [Pecten maximus]XP_033743982.1 protocadherin beta-2-like isoform X1 [Pecten maximus]